MYKEPVSLYTVADWSRWHKVLKLEAEKYGVWQYIEDSDECEGLTRPEMPVLPDCLCSIPSRAEDGDDVVERYQRALQHFNDITFPMYQLEMKRYNEDWEGLQKVEKFFELSVCKRTFGEIFTRSGSLRERVATLRQALEPSVQKQAIVAYGQLLTHLDEMPEREADTNWFVGWSRDLRERLLRCEELHVKFKEDECYAINTSIRSHLLPYGDLATSAKELDSEIVGRMRQLAAFHRAGEEAETRAELEAPTEAITRTRAREELEAPAAA